MHLRLKEIEGCLSQVDLLSCVLVAGSNRTDERSQSKRDNTAAQAPDKTPGRRQLSDSINLP